MRTYFKILSITAGIQIFGFLVCYGLDFLLESQGTSTLLPLYIGAVFVMISTILGIVLPIFLYNTRIQKIITIFLLPTNYTILICIMAIIKFVSDIGDILNNIPDNFG